MDRAQRRHLAERQKARTKRRVRRTWGQCRPDLFDDPRWVGRKARTPQGCSCPICGNLRRLLGPTRRERAFKSERIDIEDMDD